jgi:hypothetical protein
MMAHGRHGQTADKPRPEMGKPVAPRPGLLLTGLLMLPLLIWIVALLMVVLGAGLGVIQ